MSNALTPEIAVMFVLLGITIIIFAFDLLRVDVGAICILLLLALLGLMPGLNPLLPTKMIFSGFSSNAVIAILAVMILGAGLDKTGILNRLAAFIMRVGGATEKKLISMVGVTVGFTSAIMQNAGASALFLPVVSRIASRSGLALNRLLLPMGFCTILGGVLTMVGSSPLILLNDLLPENIKHIGLFEVTPVGLGLLAMGIAYFYIFGNKLLPAAQPRAVQTTTTDYLQSMYALDADMFEALVPATSPLAGMSIEDIEVRGIHIIAAQIRDENRVAPARDVEIEGGSVIALLGKRENVQAFAEQYKLVLQSNLRVFSEALIHTQAGISEIVIPPNSDLIGKTPAGVSMRKTYGLTVLNIRRGAENHADVRDIPIQSGDTLVCHSSWKNLARLLKDKNFVVLTTEFPHEELRPHKVHYAAGFMLLAIALVLFTDLPLALSLLTGAIGMVLSGVLTMDEAYQSVSWPTVFLLAGLIPVGLAVESTGTAAWITQHILSALGDMPGWVFQTLLALLATFFSLTMSNVGATVLLVPLAINIATAIGADPRIFALTVAIAASNAFILPTHPSNAILVAPGCYTVRDFLRAGAAMTVLYLLVSILILNLIF